MPTFSAQFALGKLDEMRASLSSSIRGVIFLAIDSRSGARAAARWDSCCSAPFWLSFCESERVQVS